MATLVRKSSDGLYWPANAPWSFWRLVGGQIAEEDWRRAADRSRHHLEGISLEEGADPLRIGSYVLGEEQFGPGHWQLSRAKRLYYFGVRPRLPAAIRPVLRSLLLSRQKTSFPLGWPVEDRFVRFTFETLASLLQDKGLTSLPYVHFWPDGKRYAFVLTHDVETERGQGFIRELAALEEAYGFRSSFNFVPEAYRVDRELQGELQARGFEVGVHGLKHDGRLYSSRETFQDRARRINEYLSSWGAVGFRSPFTHRHPEWMQDLDVEYDSSFFDTDPYETIPGGTMCVWPFAIGRFVELPCTLAQDHTMMVTLKEASPRLWLEKVAFVERSCGLALLNSHPDYLANPKHLAIYEDFLRQMSARADHWHALPRAVGRWWRQRASVAIGPEGARSRLDLPGASIGEARLTDQGLALLPITAETRSEGLATSSEAA